MAPLILLHVAVIFYATRQGMTAADILARTRGSLAVGVVLWRVRGRRGHSRRDRRAQRADRMVAAAGAQRRHVRMAFGAALLLLGLRAVAAVVLP